LGKEKSLGVKERKEVVHETVTGEAREKEREKQRALTPPRPGAVKGIKKGTKKRKDSSQGWALEISC